jgi:hypothetical protein
MKKFLVLFLVLFACTAYAQGIPSPSTPRLMADDAGNYVSQSYPLPVSVSGADSANIASISDALSNPLEWKVSVASVTSTISTFTSQLTSNTRRFVNAVTVETGLPINDTLYIEVPKNVPLYLISVEEVGVVIMEAGR